MTDAKKIVWVLGAGFSKPLGGPLLDDLFSPELRVEMEGRWKADVVLQERLAETQIVEQAYAAWAYPDVQKRHDLASRFKGRDPEKFIAMLGEILDQSREENSLPYAEARLIALLDAADPKAESVRTTVSAYKILGDELHGRAPTPRVVKPAISAAEFHVLALRYVVAASEYFLPDKTPRANQAEEWGPHERWANQLTSNDAIISFNYDRVVEDVRGGDQWLEVVTPKHANTLVSAGQGPFSIKNPRLYKLHGSVAWGASQTPPHDLDGNDAIPRTGLLHAPLLPAIGIPGRGKRAAVDLWFANIWKLALEAIRQADAIAFVGYRFPESDSYAKQELLGAIRSRVSEGRAFTARVVLGPPGRNENDIARLNGMLRWTGLDAKLRKPDQQRQHQRIAVEPMWSEDFFSVFERDRLTREDL